ncbi:MAG TPA: flagellar hook-length control protein FliK [Tepidimicrobium sp.]|nr:flagellar hook-length control protein FliK [Tepidimicrobium sp.]
MIDLQAIQHDNNILLNKDCSRGHTDKYSNTKFSNMLEDEVGRYKKDAKLYFKNSESTRFANGKDKEIRRVKLELVKEMPSCEEDECPEEAGYRLILILEAIGDILVELETDPVDIDADELDMLKLEMMTLFKSLGRSLEEKDPNILAEDIVEVYDNIDSLISHLREGLDQLVKDGKIISKDGVPRETFHELDKIEERLKTIGASIQFNRGADLGSQPEEFQTIGDKEMSMEQLDGEVATDEKLLDLEEIVIDRAVVEKPADIEEEPAEGVNLDAYALDGMGRRLIEDNSTVLDEELLDMDDKQIYEQIIDKARLLIDGDKQEIRIKLKPEILGELILKVESEKGALLAKIMVDSYRTKELIEANLYQFEKEIEENGLDIRTFEVFVGNNEDFQKESRQQGYYFNKKARKLNIKDHEIGKAQPYEEPYNDGVALDLQDIYAEGRLNLFA